MVFVLYFSGHHPDLLSFPTRRSSDLGLLPGRVPGLARPGLGSHPSGQVLPNGARRRPVGGGLAQAGPRSEEHTSELQSRFDLVCRLLLEKKKTTLDDTIL